MLSPADESAIMTARQRLHAVGYPADDLSDEEVWAGRRVWWGPGEGLEEVVRECPEVFRAVLRWMTTRDLPAGLEADAIMWTDPDYGGSPHRCVSVGLTYKGRTTGRGLPVGDASIGLVRRNQPGWVEEDIIAGLDRNLAALLAGGGTHVIRLMMREMTRHPWVRAIRRFIGR